MKTINVYKPFVGGSIYGNGTIRKTTKETDGNKDYDFVFESKAGSIFFNSENDRQIRGINFTEPLTKSHLDSL